MNNLEQKKKSTFREYFESIFIALLLALTIRSFVIEAFKIPSSSMVPTLLIGDHIFVNKFAYGLRVPFTKYWPVHLNKVKHGDVIVFMFPRDESLNFIKRVIGLPGDIIRVVGHDVFVNGEMLRHDVIDRSDDIENDDALYSYYREYHNNKQYTVRYEKLYADADNTYTVPDDSVFVMGDNRNNSQDSREWGAVKFDAIKGKAMFIWISCNHDQGEGCLDGGVRWDRFGEWVY